MSAICEVFGPEFAPKISIHKFTKRQNKSVTLHESEKKTNKSVKLHRSEMLERLVFNRKLLWETTVELKLPSSGDMWEIYKNYIHL